MSQFGGSTITWLGHSTVHVLTPAGKSIIIDPWLVGNPRCPETWKTTSQADIILATHAHADHIGDVIPLANRSGGQVVAIFELAGYFQSKGLKRVIDMGKGGTVVVDGVSITMVHAQHSSSVEDGDAVLYGGEPAGFVVRLESGFTFYHAGDTNVFGDMRIIKELYTPTLAMLPIGGHYTMDPREAALAVRYLGVQAVLPLHYGTFPILAGTPQRLRDLTADLLDFRVLSPEPGESLT